MTFKPSIQSLTGTHTSSADSDQCAVDWTRDHAFIIGQHSGGHYVSRFGLLTGTEEAAQALATYGAGILLETPLGIDANGNLYMVQPTGNYGGVVQIDGSDLTKILQWGTESTFSNLPNGIPQSGAFVNVPNGNVQFMLAAGIGGNSSFLDKMSVLNGPTFAGRVFSWDGTAASMCAGAPGSHLGYLIAAPESSVFTQKLVFYSILCAGLGLWSAADWPTQNSELTVTTIATILPTDIDAGWTQIYAGGMCVDQTDGHIVVSVAGQVGASQGVYFVKLNSTTGAIMWKCAMPGGIGRKMAPFSQIKHQKFCVFVWGGISDPNQVVTVNTADGSSTSYSTGLAGLELLGGQAFNDTTGQLVMYGQFTDEGSTSPTKLNSTPSSFTGWMVLYVIEAFAPPFVPGGKVSYTRTRILYDQN
jgi:hypothetical protein